MLFMTKNATVKLVEKNIIGQASVKSFSPNTCKVTNSNRIHQSNEQSIAANVLQKYVALMDAFSLSYAPHSTRFLKLLKENVSGLNDSKLHGEIVCQRCLGTFKSSYTL